MIRTVNTVALYARFSSDNQRTESIDAQIRAMESYCKQHGYVIVERYIDEAKSALTDRRPAFQQMISDSSNGNFNILLVHKLDRFARNRYDSAIYKRELKKNGVLVYSVLENLDNSPESIMMEAVLEGMSEYYSINLSREVMKGMRETALQCKHTGGTPPLGYDVDPVTKRLIINEEESKTVELIFRMYADGFGYSAILDTLHENNMLTKTGRTFQKNSLHDLLINPKYKGVYTFNLRSAKGLDGTRNNHTCKDDEDIITIKGGCPAIVDEVTFASVQKRIAENKHAGQRNTAKENYLLSGRVFCKDCGRSMVGNARHSGRNKTYHVTYKCPTRPHSCNNKEINRDYLDSYVINLLETQMLNTRSMKRIAKKIHDMSECSANEHLLEEKQCELESIAAALQNVVDAVEAGLMSEVLLERLNSLESRKATLEEEIQGLQHKDAPVRVDPSVILLQYANIKGSKSSPIYKEFIKSLITRIDVGRYSISVTLKTGLDIYPELDTTFNVQRQEIYEKGKKMSA